MKTKCFKAFLCLLVVLALQSGIFSVSAQNTDGKEMAQSFTDGIIEYNLKNSGASSVQEWVNGSITETAGSSDWYALAIRQYTGCDLSSYETSLLSYLSENTVNSASSRQKYALALIACGSIDPYIHMTVNDSVGKQGLMSWIFGLHLCNNGYTPDEYSAQDIVRQLLSLQLEDGGWAITGNTGDVDATAMAVQALAPYCKSDVSVSTAVEKALSLLSVRQQSTGDFASYGVNNPESTAQVLIALSSLGIDCTADSRFIKNGNTLLDGIGLYRLSDGSFCHTQGGNFSSTATVQVLCSTVSYLRMTEGKTNFYIFDTVGKTSPETSETEPKGKTGSNIKIWISVSVLAVAAVLSLLLYLLKKRNVKNFLVIFLVATAAVLVVVFTDIKTPDEFYGSVGSQKSDPIGRVTITIRCDTIEDKSASHIPDDGTVMETTEFEIEAGDTVYDILLEATGKNKIHLETGGTPDSVYVEGINNIYELDFGELSGWVYLVNGEQPQINCGKYELSDKDRIEWLYTCALSEDIS